MGVAHFHRTEGARRLTGTHIDTILPRIMLEAGTRTFSKWTSKWPPWIASEHRHTGVTGGQEINTVGWQESINTSKSSTRDNPTILSKHSERPDELHTRCVQWDEDHAVLAVPKKPINKGLNKYILLQPFWLDLIVLLWHARSGVCFVTLLAKQCESVLHNMGAVNFSRSLI